MTRYSARPDGQERTIAFHTTDPDRDFALHFSADGAELAADTAGQRPDLALPAEAFCRLIYGRLDPDHTPEVAGDPALLTTLCAVFPGP